MRHAFVLVFLCGCARATGAADGSAPDAAPTADAADPDADACAHYARPTGTCSAPGTCCLSSTCVAGICR